MTTRWTEKKVKSFVIYINNFLLIKALPYFDLYSGIKSIFLERRQVIGVDNHIR